MDLIKIIAIAFVTAISSLLLKNARPEFSFIITIVGVMVILLFIVESMQESVQVLHSIAQTSGMKNNLIKIVFKIVGIGYITEFSAGLLTDFGSQSLADKIVLAGKIVITLIAMPIFQTLLSLVHNFLQLV